MLQNIRITKDFKDIEKLNRLNEEAFPKNERLEINEILEMSTYKEVDFMAIYDENIFVGYYLVFKQDDLVYIYFLAVDESLRNKGYGTRIIKLMEEIYLNYTIILDLEEIDESVLNNLQRISRKNFYLRNGYKETSFGMAYVGMRFEILVYKKDFDINKFKPLIELTKTIINKHSDNKFEPSFLEFKK